MTLSVHCSVDVTTNRLSSAGSFLCCVFVVDFPSGCSLLNVDKMEGIVCTWILLEYQLEPRFKTEFQDPKNCTIRSQSASILLTSSLSLSLPLCLLLLLPLCLFKVPGRNEAFEFDSNLETPKGIAIQTEVKCFGHPRKHFDS